MGTTRGITTAILLATMLGGAAGPASAQMSDSYNFLKAVRDRDGAKVMPLLDAPGAPVLNARDYATGETALHIVTKRRDLDYLSVLLARGASVDTRDKQGNTPLALAAQLGWDEGIRLLVHAGANVNAANGSGETPLILAVQQRQLPAVRILLAGGADPSIPDHVAGRSARDYAADDARGAAMLRLMDAVTPPAKAPAKP